jgi:hypothetical protein
MGTPSTKQQGLAQLERFLLVDGKKEVKWDNVRYYDPQGVRASGALVALGVRINGYGIEMSATLRRQIGGLVHAASFMTDSQAVTILKVAKLGWELASIEAGKVNGASVVTPVFNLKSPGGVKARIDTDGKFVRL